MKMYVVTYRPEANADIVCKVMNGTELANLYGFAGCTGVEVLYAYWVTEYGHLAYAGLRNNWKPPYNWLIVTNGYGAEIARYEWPEH